MKRRRSEPRHRIDRDELPARVDLVAVLDAFTPATGSGRTRRWDVPNPATPTNLLRSLSRATNAVSTGGGAGPVVTAARLPTPSSLPDTSASANRFAGSATLKPTKAGHEDSGAGRHNSRRMMSAASCSGT